MKHISITLSEQKTLDSSMLDLSVVLVYRARKNGAGKCVLNGRRQKQINKARQKRDEKEELVGA